MHKTLAYAMLTLSALITNIAATNPKANEYKSDDCSGSINYRHASAFLPHDITMDDTSNFVYLAGGEWVGYPAKTKNGGSCEGAPVLKGGDLPSKCVDLFEFGTKIECVRRR